MCIFDAPDLEIDQLVIIRSATDEVYVSSNIKVHFMYSNDI